MTFGCGFEEEEDSLQLNNSLRRRRSINCVHSGR